MIIIIRRRVLGELAVAAAKVNEFAYEMAIKANRVQGRLLEQADGRPRHLGIAPSSPGR